VLQPTAFYGRRNRGCPISRTFFVRDVGAMYRVQIATRYLAIFWEGYGLQPVRKCFEKKSACQGGSHSEWSVLIGSSRMARSAGM